MENYSVSDATMYTYMHCDMLCVYINADIADNQSVIGYGDVSNVRLGVRLGVSNDL